MSRLLTVSMLVVTSLFAGSAYGAAGETWDVTTKSLDGEGVGVPEVAVTVCLAPGETKNPQQFLRQDDNCKFTDLKTVGKRSTWKMQCGSGDDQLTGTGEVTYSTNSFQGVTKLKGRSDGEPVNAKMTYQGKKVGAACDTTAPPVVKGMEGFGEVMSMAKTQMAAAMAEQCEVANHEAADLISARFFGASAACPGKEKPACKAIAKAVAKDPRVYAKLAKYEDSSELGIAKTCNIDMAATAKAICAKVDHDNYRELADACPQEVKAFDKAQQSPPGQGNAPGAGGGNVSNIIDNAVKLKGFFGF